MSRRNSFRGYRCMSAIAHVRESPEGPRTAHVSENGVSDPLGATVISGGVNFSVYSRSATAMELLLFDFEDAQPARVIPIDPVANRTYHYWHVFVPGLAAGQIYGYRVYGPYNPDGGFRFDSSKVLLDPYGRAVVVPKNYSRSTMTFGVDNSSTAMKSVVVDPSD